MELKSCCTQIAGVHAAKDPQWWSGKSHDGALLLTVKNIEKAGLRFPSINILEFHGFNAT
jgi:hypothetical protein